MWQRLARRCQIEIPSMVDQRRVCRALTVLDLADQDRMVARIMALKVKAFKPRGTIRIIKHERAVGRPAQRYALEACRLRAVGKASCQSHLCRREHVYGVAVQALEMYEG